jgi:hypothetical protein
MSTLATPHTTIARLRQQGNKIDNTDHAYRRIREWETWFKNSSTSFDDLPRPQNPDARKIDDIVKRNACAMIAGLTGLSDPRPQTPAAAKVIQDNLISPPITTTLRSFIEKLDAGSGGLSPVMSHAAKKETPAEAFIWNAVESAVAKLTPTQAKLPLPQAMTQALKARNPTRKGGGGMDR